MPHAWVVKLGEWDATQSFLQKNVTDVERSGGSGSRLPGGIAIGTRIIWAHLAGTE